MNKPNNFTCDMSMLEKLYNISRKNGEIIALKRPEFHPLTGHNPGLYWPS
jgi:hypothetical protein